jgi:hypothetical protein
MITFHFRQVLLYSVRYYLQFHITTVGLDHVTYGYGGTTLLEMVTLLPSVINS